MEPFRKVEAVAAPITFDNVDTDQIIPARFMRNPRENGNYARFFLHDYRFKEEGGQETDFVLNQPPYRNAGIIVASKNYGCGSSRIGAVYVHLDYGIRAVIAVSYGDVFFNNCLKNGVLCVRLPEEQVNVLRQAIIDEPGSGVTVDLEQQTVQGPGGQQYSFDIDVFAKKCLLEGLTDIDLTLSQAGLIDEFEKAHKGKIRWLYPIARNESNPAA